ncbi:MAG: hypothetical protein QXJ63_03320 [Candidatus Bathyarchaeia archaeon]
MAKKAKTETGKQGLASIDSGCPHYFGYLRERARGEGIPEECLACEKAVECMISELKSPSPKPKPEEEHLEESLEQVTKETVEEDQFVVQNMGILYAMWTSTVRIPKEILSLWGGKVKEVEIETLHGKKTRCKVAPIESLKGKIIEVPDKVQYSLGIAKGEFVKVKPCR